MKRRAPVTIALLVVITIVFGFEVLTGAFNSDAALIGAQRGYQVVLALPANASPERRRILRACAAIPFGEVSSYRAMATRAGSSGAIGKSTAARTSGRS